MKSLSRIFLAGLVGLSATVLPPVHAQTNAAVPAAPEFADAEVRKIDKANKKITLKHGEIKNLNMPPMTMVFQVGDAKALDKLQPGDKVRFRAANLAGKYTVTEIAPAR